MKNKVVLGSVLAVVGLWAGCSTLRGGTSGNELAASGPTVIDAKAQPSTFEVNRKLQPISDAQVLAEVKDFNGKVTQVHLRFRNAPIDIAMKQLNSSAWEAELTPDQLKELAVNGTTMNYQANVIATDSKGKVAMGESPVTISVKAPDMSNS
jgi:hypothetical protein